MNYDENYDESYEESYDDDYDLRIKRSMKPGNEKLARKREAERIKHEKRKKRNKTSKAAIVISKIIIALFFIMLLVGAYFIFFTDMTINIGNGDTVSENEPQEEDEDVDITEKFTKLFTGGKKKSKSKSGETRYVEIPKTDVQSNMYSDPGKYALTTDYDYVTADADYYKDALFIGDSRIEGFKLYGNIDGATYYSKVGISFAALSYEKIAMAPNGNMVTIKEALKQTQFKKIYIMAGVNNMGSQSTTEFFNNYKEFIDMIRSEQPDAKIFILSIMHVSAKYNDGDRGLTNNININDRNVAISTLADGKDIFYFNLNQLIVGDDGDILPGFSGDGLHLKSEHYHIWVDYLNEHALPPEDFE